MYLSPFTTLLRSFPNYTICFLHRQDFPLDYTLSLHDALPICSQLHQPRSAPSGFSPGGRTCLGRRAHGEHGLEDRKSTRLNSSHSQISYAVFCLKKKKKSRSSEMHTSQLHSHARLSYPLSPCI